MLGVGLEQTRPNQENESSEVPVGLVRIRESRAGLFIHQAVQVPLDGQQGGKVVPLPKKQTGTAPE